MKKKKLILSIVIVIAILIAGICIWYFGFKKPHAEALTNYVSTTKEYNQKILPYNNIVNEYNTVINALLTENQKLDAAISSAQTIIDTGEKPYAATTLSTLSNMISSAKNCKISAPKLMEPLQEVQVTDNDKQLNTDEINLKISDISKQMQTIDNDIKTLEETINKFSDTPDYSDSISQLQTAQTALENSISVNKQIMNPSEDFVKTKLSTISSITEIQSVTEDNDPNGNLNKAGGYTSTVYFSVSSIDQSEVLGNTVIDKGTEAGGSIEVYSTIEDAEKRNTYLASYDGTILATGSHTVLGTIVIRTSDKLTASQQKELENQIIDNFTSL